MAQFSRPDADVSVGTWQPSTGSTLYTMIDEVTSDTSDYIEGAANQQCQLGLSEFTDPGVYTGWNFKITYYFDNTFFGKFPFNIAFFDGTTQISNAYSIGGTDDQWVTQTIGLSSADAQAIAQASDLRVTLYNDTGSLAVIAWFEVEGPDALSTRRVFMIS